MSAIIGFIKTFVTGFLKNNGLKVLGFLGKGIVSLWTIFIRPFFFSASKPTLIVPYFYVAVGNIFQFFAIGLDIFLVYKAAFFGIKDPMIVLGSLNALIVTLTAFNNLMITVYNSGKAGSGDTTIIAPNDTSKPVVGA